MIKTIVKPYPFVFPEEGTRFANDAILLLQKVGKQHFSTVVTKKPFAKKISTWIAISICLLLGWPHLARSESQEVDSRQPDLKKRAIEEVIVTARKRDETLMDIPVSVSAVTGEQFRLYDFNEMRGLADMTPGFYMDNSTTGPRMSMRGQGNTVTGPTFEQSVGLSIDGIYFGRRRWFEIATFDVEQVEVLRGPQGVYFGKNTTAGLIKIKSREPGDEWTLNASVGNEAEFGKDVYEGGIGGPITGWIGVRAAIQNREEDGFLDNVNVGGNDRSLDQTLGRFSVDINPTDNLKIQLRLQKLKSDFLGQTSQLAECGDDLDTVLELNNSREDCRLNNTRTAGPGVEGGYVKFNKEFTDNESDSQALSISWRVSGYELSYTLGNQKQDVDFTLDPDFSDLRFLGIAFPEVYKQVSHEFRIVTPTFSRVEILFGVYMDDSELDTEQNLDFDITDLASSSESPLNGLLPTQSAGSGSSFKRMIQDTKAEAVFSEVRIELMDSLRLLLGGRYTRESKEAAIVQELGSLGDPFDDDPVAKSTFNNVFRFTEIDHTADRETKVFSPSAIIQWDFLPSARLYLSYKEGFKSGGFDSNVSRQESDGTITAFEFDDEQVESYELGLKSKWFENTLSTTLAVFKTEYTDLQVQAFDGFAGVDTLNAGESTNEGAELELKWRPFQSLTISGTWAYVDATYDEFPVAPCYPGQSEEEGCRDGAQDLAGETLPMAPKHSRSISLDWSRVVFENFHLALGVNLNYRDEVILNLAQSPNAVAESRILTNAYFSISDAQQRYSLSVTVKNVTDEDYVTGFISMPLFTGSYIMFSGEPRTVHSTFRVNL